MESTKKTDYQPRTIRDWLTKFRHGKIALPSFQRSYVWTGKKVARLLAALLTDRPVGALLSIECSDTCRERFEPRSFFNVEVDTDDEDQALETFEVDVSHAEELILDGQQRLTSLWQALRKHQGYYVEVDGWGTNEFRVAESDEPVCQNPSDQDFEEKKLIPLSVLGIDGVTQEEKTLLNWCINECRNEEEAKKLAKKIDATLTQKITDRRLFFVQLPKTVTPKKAIQIYIQTNQSSSIIKDFDIAVAMYDQKNPRVPMRTEIEAWIERTDAARLLFSQGFQKNIDEVGELICKIACLQTEQAPTNKNYWTDNAIEHLHSSSKGIKRIKKDMKWAFGVLGDECKCFYKKHLPSKVPLRVLPALRPELRKIKDPDYQHLASEVISSYLWRSFLGNRYERGANTRLKEDYDKLVEVLSHISEHGTVDLKKKILEVPIFSIDIQIPSKEDLSPKKKITKQSIRKALLLISLLNGAKDFANGHDIKSATVQDRQEHHIFPKKFLRDNGIVNKDAINHPLNIALIGSKANRTISNKPPMEYIQERYLKNPHLTEKQMQERINSHLIPYDEIKGIDAVHVKATYPRFIEERAKLFENKIKELTKVPFQD